MNADRRKKRKARASKPLTAEDLAFVHKVLCEGAVTVAELGRAMDDLAFRRQLLGDPALFAVVSRSPAPTISDYLHYYIMAGHMLLAAGLDDSVFTEQAVRSLVEMARLQRLQDGAEGAAPRRYPLSMQVRAADQSDGAAIEVVALLGHYRLELKGYLHLAGKKSLRIFKSRDNLSE